VECDFDKIQNTNSRSYFVGTTNHPFKIDTISSEGNKYVFYLYANWYETIETFADDVASGGQAFFFGEEICTKGDYMEFVIKQWADSEGTWRKTLEIDGVLMARFTSSTAPTSSTKIYGRLGDSDAGTQNGLGVKNYSIREY